MGSGEWKCGELYGKHIEGVEADFPNQTVAEHRLLTAATRFC